MNDQTVVPDTGTCAPPAQTEPTFLEQEIERMRNRTPEEIMAAREEILSSSPPPRPIPEGKTLLDMVEGTWPGDETDQEIFEMLEKLS